jgi:hypothetical protein
MPVARHIAIALVIRENNHEVQLLLGQWLDKETKRQSQAKRDPFQAVQQRRSHARQPNGTATLLKEKKLAAWPNICGEKWPVDLRGSVFVRFFNAGADTL